MTRDALRPLEGRLVWFCGRLHTWRPIALAEGQRQAKTTADALGLRRVQLLRIDQRGGGPIRPMPYAMAARKGFNPDEARQPESSVSLDLDYCLS